MAFTALIQTLAFFSPIIYFQKELWGAINRMERKNLEPRNILLIMPGNKIILSFWHFIFVGCACLFLFLSWWIMLTLDYIRYFIPVTLLFCFCILFIGHIPEHRHHKRVWGSPGDLDGKESSCNAGDLGLIPGSGKIPRRREWLPIPVFLPGEFHGESFVHFVHCCTSSA